MVVTGDVSPTASTPCAGVARLSIGGGDSIESVGAADVPAPGSLTIPEPSAPAARTTTAASTKAA